ncbi:hypothetical protein SOVF_024270 [Spinacia oleracea]|nr:hypothetical protein SOVF_024270 [Spinacia oleracea]
MGHTYVSNRIHILLMALLILVLVTTPSPALCSRLRRVLWCSGDPCGGNWSPSGPPGSTSSLAQTQVVSQQHGAHDPRARNNHRAGNP